MKKNNIAGFLGIYNPIYAQLMEYTWRVNLMKLWIEVSFPLFGILFSFVVSWMLRR